MPGAPVADPSISSSFDCFADASASTAPLEGMDGPPSVNEGKGIAVEEGQEVRQEKRAKLDYRSYLERNLIRARARVEFAREAIPGYGKEGRGGGEADRAAAEGRSIVVYFRVREERYILAGDVDTF